MPILSRPRASIGPRSSHLYLRIQQTLYAVSPLECDPSIAAKAFRLNKPDGTLYDVAQTHHGHRCDCPDFIFRRDGLDPSGCKHVKALIHQGLLDHPEETSRRGQAGSPPSGLSRSQGLESRAGWDSSGPARPAPSSEEMRMTPSAPLILSACRTPIGRYLGGLSGLSAIELGVIAAREALARAGVDPAEVDEAIVGNVLSAGLGQAPARQVALGAGMPPTSSALTVNMVCGSGLRAVMLAASAIRAGDADLVLAGGMESMSNAPHLLRGGRGGWKLGDRDLVDSMLHDGLTCAVEGWPMGHAAERTAEQCGLSRADLDAFALESQRRAVAAQSGRRLRGGDRAGPRRGQGKGEQGTRGASRCPPTRARAAIRPPRDWLAWPRRSAPTASSRRATRRPSATARRWWSSPPRRRPGGWAPGRSPGSSRRRSPASTRATSSSPPSAPSARPSPGRASAPTRSISTRSTRPSPRSCSGASAAWRSTRRRVNVHGGAIALGHPIGASGARVLVTLLHALERRQERLGLAALCLGGGNAVAMIVERVA